MGDKSIAKKYQKLTSIQHVLKRPGMYVGGIEEVKQYVFLIEDGSVVYKNIKYSPGLYKIFDEIIVNAYDQTVRDPSVKNIKVELNKEKNEITVMNDGKGIDVVMHPKEKVYVPELIFSHLRTSTSFAEESRITGGIHGLGAKLTAILSSYFKVEVGDSIHKKQFTQVYKNNLSFRSKPKIKPYEKPTGYVKIIFKPDLKYFGTPTIGEDLWSLMARRVYDVAALTRSDVKVSLDGLSIPIKSFDMYAKMFTQEPYVKIPCKNSTDRWQIVVSRAPLEDRGFKQVSFVNGIYTSNGGRHVEYILNRVVKGLKDYISSKYKTSKITTQFVKDSIWLLLASVIENPSFSSQTKDELMTPVAKFGSSCDIPPSVIKKIYKKFDLDTIVKQQVLMLQKTELAKLDVKKKKTVKGIPKLYDANYAGTKKSKECTLILTEGDSAKTMAISGLGAISKGNNTFGVFPLKGKMLNVREASHKQIVNNKEFVNLKQILGLTTGKKYNEENIGELRYGHVMLMMDADVDGSHIKGLFINMIHYFWPTLLKVKGFIKVFVTPVVKVSKGSDTKSFYTLSDYDKWKKSVGDPKKWTIKYYKGLGTNTAAEAKEYFKNLDKHSVDFEWVESTDESIRLAFAKDKANDRKKWLAKYDPDTVLDYDVKQMSYKDFVNKELIHFSNYDNLRSIPSLVDGLKPSQRKVMYAAFKRNLVSDIKVAQFVGYVSEVTSYHHGETSLANTIIGMAQNFVGSNNVNLLEPKGQFGTRLMGGKDHSSPRYIFTNLPSYTRHIFHKDDDSILQYMDDDGYSIEPEYYVPVLPTILVNGSEGIGTGYSTFIPKFNPSDIISGLRARISGQKFKPISPWYRGFKGLVVRKDATTYITKGIYMRDKNKIRVTELPITLWTETYKTFLEETIMAKPYISSVLNNSTESTVDFTIKFKDASVIDKLEKDKTRFTNGVERLLLLVKVINLTNMHLYNKDGVITKYKGVTKILEEFYKVRLEFYVKRKAYLLARLKVDLEVLQSKVKFIGMVLDKKLSLLGKAKKDILSTLRKHKLYVLKGEPEYDYLLKIHIYVLTKEKIDELKKQLSDKRKQYKELLKIKPEDIWLSDLDKLEKMLND